jgi:hypothetical protein
MQLSWHFGCSVPLQIPVTTDTNGEAFVKRLLARIVPGLIGVAWIGSLSASATWRAGDAWGAEAERDTTAYHRVAMELGPTSDPPWNPPSYVHRQVWEEALLLPGRVVSLPLVMVRRYADNGLLFLERTRLGPILQGDAMSRPDSGWFNARLVRLGDRAGFSLGTMAHYTVYPGKMYETRFAGGYSGSTRNYNRTVLSVSGHPAGLVYTQEWRPQDRFFGVGLDTRKADVSDYATQTKNLRGELLWGWKRDSDAGAPHTVLEFHAGPRTLVTRTGRQFGIPSYQDVFPDVAATSLDQHVDHLIYGASFSSDWRAGIPHWSEGWRVRVAVDRYDRPMEWLALRSGRVEGAQFTRTDVETETGWSFWQSPRTFRLLLHLTDEGVTSGEEGRMAIYDLATIGGHSALTGFDTGRFHDLDAVSARLSYIFPLGRRLEMDTHVETGSVYQDLWSDATPGSFRQSAGFTLRGKTDLHPIGALGLDRSREGWRISYSFGSAK